MNVLAISSILSIVSSSAVEQPKVIGASLFKNGFAVVLREVNVAADKVTVVEELPDSVLGTLWFNTEPGLTLKEVTVGEDEKVKARAASGMAELLEANKGATLTLELPNNQTLTGKLLSASGSIAIMETSDARHAVQISDIKKLVLPGGAKVETEDKSKRLVMRIAGEKGQSGKLYYISLEKGMTWAPAYQIDLSGKSKVSVLAKATITNPSDKIQNLDLKLITGFPNIRYLNERDPLTSIFGKIGLPLDSDAAPWASNTISLEKGRSASAGMPIPMAGGDQLEDMFFYTLKNVSMNKGDRGYFPIFSFESPVKHIYAWDVPTGGGEEMPGVVWHSIEFENRSGIPLSAGTSVIVKNGEILAQDKLEYTSKGATVKCNITKALDVQAKSMEEEEISRQTAAITEKDKSTYDLVVRRGKIKITSKKAEPIMLTTNLVAAGEIVSVTGNPAKKKLASYASPMLARTRVVWNEKIMPGESRELSYTYKQYVSSGRR